MNRSVNWLAAAFFLLFGAVYLAATFQIPESFGGGHINRFVPAAASFLVVALAVIQIVRTVRPAQDGEQLMLRDVALLAAPLMLLAAACGILQIAFGYLAATSLGGIAVFRLFGNSWRKSLLHSIAGTAVLYIVFFRLLNLYDAPGRILDLSGILPI